MSMSNTSPSTPTAKSHRTAVNRSFTVPAKMATTSPNGPTAEIGAAQGIETLYVHPSANVIKFTTSGPWSRSRSSGDRPSSSSGGGTLPWASLTERTMAAGPLEIYRVPGTVSFLHSGALLHAILPRSQCWCVDGVSKFALRVLQDTYYRIELPGETPEDLAKVEEFKVTLAKVLFYERTPCPFARTFTVDLPEQPLERRSKRRTSHGPAKKWKLHRAYSWRPEDGGEPPRGASSGSEGIGSEEDSDARATGERSDDDGSNTSELADQIKELGVNPTRRRQLSPVRRSVTAPVPSPSVARIRTNFDTDGTIPTDMPPSPPDSSAGFEPPETPSRVPATARQVHAGDLERAGEEEQEIADARTDETPMRHEHIPPQAELSTAAHDWRTESTHSNRPSEPTSHRPLKPLPQPASPIQPPSDPPNPPLDRVPSHEDPFAAIQARILARRSIGGTTSFHPTRTSPTRAESTSSTSSTATLTSRTSSVDRQQAFATALVKKACAAFLGPPAHLVAIMLRIAARIASGTFGSVFLVESPRGHRRVPGSFDLRSLDDDELGVHDGEETLDGWDEDDFGVPLRSPIRLASFTEGAREGLRERAGWDVD
ncbi:Inheritance of peroxisomes protein 1 [Teratosphaeria destructans]|uniref:Inheritance of peroxisomes protein 1 n=1 Tax=Teratosphaeria destructans TaxID=418781 RepID=A0A9W7SY09_9PEZI|nr:Inheritance of peroxisomes protein 1 [Teratosphaeria destructans]